MPRYAVGMVEHEGKASVSAIQRQQRTTHEHSELDRLDRYQAGPGSAQQDRRITRVLTLLGAFPT